MAELSELSKLSELGILSNSRDVLLGFGVRLNYPNYPNYKKSLIDHLDVCAWRVKGGMGGSVHHIHIIDQLPNVDVGVQIVKLVLIVRPPPSFNLTTDIFRSSNS